MCAFVDVTCLLFTALLGMEVAGTGRVSRSPCRWKSTGVHGTLMLAVKRQYEAAWCIDPGGLDDN